MEIWLHVWEETSDDRVNTTKQPYTVYHPVPLHPLSICQSAEALQPTTFDPGTEQQAKGYQCVVLVLKRNVQDVTQRRSHTSKDASCFQLRV